MTFARIGAVVLAGSLCLFVAGCCCPGGGGAGRHSGPVYRDRVIEREAPPGPPSVTRQLQDLDDAYRRKLISRDEYEASRRRILEGDGGISRQ